MKNLHRSFFALCIVGMSNASLPATAATADDACGIPFGVVSAAVGGHIVKTEPRPEISSCSYHSAGIVPSVSVTTYRDDSVAAAQAGFKQKVDGLAAALGPSAGATKPVAGLGDEAESLGDQMLYVRKGTATYVFSLVDSMRAPAKLPRLVKLAKVVMVRVKP